MRQSGTSRKIIFVFIGLAIFAYGILLFRFFTIQVISRGKYSEIRKNKSRIKVTLKGDRGLILDRNLSVLANNIYRYSLGADLSKIKNREKLATLFARATNKSPRFYLRKLRPKRGFVYLVRDVQKQEMVNWDLPDKKEEPGFQTIRENRRIYPYSQSAAAVIGFTNVDNRGMNGIEGKYNSILQGEDGWQYFQMDGFNRLSPGLNLPEKLSTKGENLILSLNMNYQMIAEEELARGVIENKARGGTIVMLNPKTGEVLAMASYPGFNPNKYRDYKVWRYKNRTITDVFEPGSTFKIVTAAAALESKKFRMSDVIFCENGVYKMAGVLLRDHKSYGKLTFKKVIEYSSNIGVAKIARKVGKKRVFNMARAFGFGNPTGIDLPGEVGGRLKNATFWSRSDATRIPIGYGVSITTLQLANAYAAVANGGYLLRPYVMKMILSPNDELVKEIKPDTIRKVLSRKTAHRMTEIFKGVVKIGTGKRAALTNVEVAGKTGTAQKYDLKERGYSHKRYVASFVGYVPADNPQLVCAVVIDEPQKYHYGGEVAAPIFHKIMQRIVDSVDEEPEPPAAQFGTQLNSGLVSVPDVRFVSYSKAKAILVEAGLKIAAYTHGNFVVQQVPVPDHLVKSGSIISVRLEKQMALQESDDAKFPDVRGLSIRQAVKTLAEYGYEVRVEGSGFVIRQSILNSKKKICKIVCKPRVNTG